MVAFIPIRIGVVKPEWAEKVAAPAHDSMTARQRAAFMADNPDSYLGVTRSPAPGSDETIDEVVTAGRKALDRLLELEVFGEPTEQFYVYEISNNLATQRSIVGGADVTAYAEGGIRTHEQVHPNRLELLTRHFEVVQAQSSPIALAHRPSAVIDEIVSRTSAGEPLVDFTSFGLTQRVWAIDRADDAAIAVELADQPFYVIDGHHRLGTAQRYFGRNDNAASEWAYVALSSSSELNNLAYHRVIDITAEDFVAKLANHSVRTSDEYPTDQADDELLFHTGTEWLLVTVNVVDDADDPLAQLDPVVLQREILGPVFNLGGSSDAIDYRPGFGSPADLASEVASHGDGIFACMRPISIPELMAVADAGEDMPPKSTYFIPKIRSGVFLRPLDY